MLPLVRLWELPGFSATRQEIAPTAELVADALGANLFETRLAGHGRTTNAMQGVVAEDWLADAAEALAIGAKIGDRTILVGTSTGATLAMAMVGHAAMDNVEAIVMVSPNFAPQEPGARWLTRPLGPLLARIFIGETRSWTPKNEEQGLYWSTSYPMATVIEVMRLVRLTDHPNLRVSLDTYHLVTEILDFREAILTVKDALWGMHMCESNRGVPGEGLIPWPTIFEALKEIGFDDYILFEAYNSSIDDFAFERGMFHNVCPDPAVFVGDGMNFLKQGLKG